MSKLSNYRHFVRYCKTTKTNKQKQTNKNKQKIFFYNVM